jgi:hypothetical protein
MRVCARIMCARARVCVCVRVHVCVRARVCVCYRRLREIKQVKEMFINNAQYVLKRFDKNRDGSLTKEEFGTLKGIKHIN